MKKREKKGNFVLSFYVWCPLVLKYQIPTRSVNVNVPSGFLMTCKWDLEVDLILNTYEDS